MRTASAFPSIIASDRARRWNGWYQNSSGCRTRSPAPGIGGATTSARAFSGRPGRRGGEAPRGGGRRARRGRGGGRAGGRRGVAARVAEAAEVGYDDVGVFDQERDHVAVVASPA